MFIDTVRRRHSIQSTNRIERFINILYHSNLSVCGVGVGVDGRVLCSVGDTDRGG